jgi:hypothetical protein
MKRLPIAFGGVATAAAVAYEKKRTHDLNSSLTPAYSRVDALRTVFEPATITPSTHSSVGKSKSTSSLKAEEDCEVVSVRSEEDSVKSSIIDGEFGWESISHLFPVNSFSSIFSSDPSAIEADSAIEAINESPDLLPQIVPKGYHDLSPELKDEICEKARAQVTNPWFLDQVREKIEGKKAAAAPERPSTPRDDEERTQWVEKWEKLKEKYPCAVCQDVLAGPVILGCSHTFCGYCVQSMIDRCSCEGEGRGVEVVHHCPLCTTPIEHCVYERMLSANIEAEAQQFSWEYRAHWDERRRAYEKSCEKARRRKAAYEHRTDVEDEPVWVRQVREYWVPVLAFAAIIVIAWVRSK